MALNTANIQAAFRSAYEVLITAVADEVTLRLRSDAGTYTDVGPIKAKVAELRLSEIVPGSAAQVGDLRAILLAQSIPADQRRMEMKDRVLWRGREYAVIQYDDASASIGAEVMAVNIILRG